MIKLNMISNKHNHLLIIEDTPDIAITLKKILEKELFHVTWKNTGQEGVNYALDKNPDLIILDVRLPDGSGFDFCHTMRLKKYTNPILMLTVKNDEMDKVLGLEMGADDYLTKPFANRELISRIRALIRRSFGEYATSSNDILYFQNFILDRNINKLTLGDEEIPLSPTEYKLLVFLAQNIGAVKSRSQILESVWDTTIESIDEKVVNVYIRRLRKKIEIDPKTPKILLTVPGAGYRMIK